MDATATEIHHYPLWPEGFEEPLFATTASRRVVLEHLLEAPWLHRASELRGCGGEAAHALEEPVELRGPRGRVDLVRPGARRRRMVEILDRWREVRGWWDEDNRVDRMVFRVLLAGGTVVDLARERSGWYLLGVVD